VPSLLDFRRCGAAAIAGFILLSSSPGSASRSCEASHIVGGGAGLCVLRQDGRVACWGDDPFIHSPRSPSPGGFFAQVSVGSSYSCGVRQDGAAVCWGKHEDAPLPAPQGEFKQLSVAGGEVWGLRPDGSVVLVDAGDGGPEPTPPSGIFLEIAGRCGRRPDATLECWYDNVTPPAGTFEQLSLACGLRTNGQIECWGGFEDVLGPPPSGTFSQVAASYGPDLIDPGACAVAQDGSVACWGDVEDEPAPAGTFREVAVGVGRPCGIRTSGSVECWPPWPDVHDYNTGPVIGSFTQVAAGGDPGSRPLTCAIEVSGRIACWGDDQFGQTSPPEGVFTQVAASNYHACGLRADGTISCWGVNDLKDREAPAGTFTQITTGSLGPNCALRVGGSIACWGFGSTDLGVPDGQFVQVTSGGQQACALDGDGVPACWRYVYDDDGVTVVMEPIDSPAGPFAQLSASGDFILPSSLVCGVRPGGSVECWGDDVDGLLDAPDGEFVQVSAGAGGACALDIGGGIECWGGIWNDGYAPPEGEFVQVASGYGYACGLTADASVVCAGVFDQTVSFCGPSSRCGDGVVDEAETCDDGDVVYEIGNSCTDACVKVPCGQPIHPESEGPGASDALFALHTAVGFESCDLTVCDINDSATITVVDALGILTKAVDLPVTLDCPL